MNITPIEFINLIKEGKSEAELNKLIDAHIDSKEVNKLIKYGHTAASAREHLETDYTNGFTICKHCGSYYHLGEGFTKHLSNGCANCEGVEKHYTYYHKGNNERNYKSEPRWMQATFDDGMHYKRDKLEINKFSKEVSELNEISTK